MPHAKMRELAQLGQSLWIDNISRSMITSGKLKSLIGQGLRGQTSNPTIFKQAISTSHDYDRDILALTRAGKSTFDIYDELTIKDVGEAADLFRGVYDQTKGLDGYVSLEINPKLANESDAQSQEGLRLWRKLNRPNAMIKVPATKNGCLVVEKLISQGVNVNVTLIFSAEQYSQVVWAYCKGIKVLAQRGGDPSRVRSVASVFVSRLDTAVDQWIDGQSDNADAARKIQLMSLRGAAAVSNCEIIFHKFQNAFASDEFKGLEAQGARLQRVLWASTGTKDPKYSDLKYVTELMASPTVNTLPDKTLDAYLDHGTVKTALPYDVARAQGTIGQLRLLGIDVNVVCGKLLEEGLAAFEKSFEELMASIEEKSRQCVSH
ncbi:MAG: transaldolase [Candidatus Omnitrophica bacterium]|nr:transaldolase [Candidatus Omnitrophota bacterium]